ncbi:hypothetical protein M885DRAFT_555206 [Pelagophyceae sp. CCMP2097]|nr:hypothetical protein M885DRAFT_555206 [Pelagophyceae sp. CCMP2097]
MLRHGNAYHNLRHAVDVLQTSAAFLFTLQCDGSDTLAASLPPLETLALLLAALCHDLDHPGVTNAFLVATRAPLALRYNDNSVLESMHCALLWETLASDPRLDVTAKLPQQEAQLLRQITICAILKTDLSMHADIVRSLKALALRPDPLSLAESRRELVVPALLHCADISNAAKPWPISKRWSDAILTEFYLQGDAERESGACVSASMDRETTSQPTCALGFADFIVAPILQALQALHPPFAEPLTDLCANREVWVDIREGRRRADGETLA